ncbi:MAG: rod shape-determining protein MreC [Bryobacteraceae bacterium]|jgi:rod shape-determining protein MreC
MDSFLGRYRNLSVLLLLVVGQLLLLAWQIRSSQDVPLIRVWAVTAVTPLARAVESARDGTARFLSQYVVLGDLRAENERLRREVADLRLKNHLLAAELASADRARALEQFRARTPSKTLPVRVIGTGAGPGTHTVFVDRGSSDGVQRGMAAITPEGIVGKVVASYPMASLVQLITAQGAAASVISVKSRLRGSLKGTGGALCVVDHIDNKDPLEPGEWFYTSGADRVFPRGLPVGQVALVREGRAGKEVLVEPSGLKNRLEEMLIVLDGVHQWLPSPDQAPGEGVSLLPPPPPETASGSASAAPAANGGALTDADRLAERYRRLTEAQGVQLGVKGRIPDFTREPPEGAAPAPAPKKAGPPQP